MRVRFFVKNNKQTHAANIKIVFLLEKFAHLFEFTNYIVNSLGVETTTFKDILMKEVFQIILRLHEISRLTSALYNRLS